jgi:hypothetical protein
MTSKRKIQANQENAKQSTGPTTPEGKETASRNSYKHGIWAKELVISKEETPDYEKLVTDLEAALKPEGPITAEPTPLLATRCRSGQRMPACNCSP